MKEKNQQPIPNTRCFVDADGQQAEELTTAKKLMMAIMRFNKAGFRQRIIEGVKMSEMRLMFIVNKSKKQGTSGLKVSEISSMLGVTSPTVTQMIKSLESKEWIERTMDDEDRRAVRVNLTEKGDHIIRKVMGAMVESFDGLIEFMGEEDSNQLANLLTKAYMYYEENEDKLNEDHLNCTGGDGR
ncbi:MarR family winged helix-turn-helix transcriptional regulator [Paenibacillus pini]|uniref:Transcriptional regulator n=1 Tax=Paenibacillus pini JCM 16418 TaxID=1236976 RepID=W7YSB7_9BACL|nr:MarR family transcriptional regulator [Paenibacillus pini]GAF10108.1 transcriptional regulator [Paenibacillus pini JCM 16418]